MVAQTMRVATEPQHKDGIPALERYWKEADGSAAYGAPQDLHASVEATVKRLLK